MFNTRIPLDKQDDYEAAKMILLDAFGDTVDLARQQWWTLRKLHTETFQDCMIRIEEKFQRGARRNLTACLPSILPAECRTYVLERNPGDGMAAAHLAGEFYRINPWKDRSNYSSKYVNRESAQLTRTSEKKDPGVQTEQTPGQSRQNPRPTERDPSRDTYRVPICYSCVVKGHKKPDCPKRVRRLRSPQPKVSSLYVKGKIGDVECSKMVIDSGATQTTVHPNLVPKAQYTGDSILVHLADGSPMECPLAKVCLHLGDRSVQHEVAVLKTGIDDAICSCTGIYCSLRRNKRLLVNPVRITRKQAAKEADQEKLEDAATVQSGAKPVDLSEILDFDDLFFEDDDLIQATSDAQEDVLQLPLPVPLESDDHALLVKQQREDATLASLRELADHLENGYKYEDELLIHEEFDEMGTGWKRIVVPTGRRPAVLSLAHSSSMSGHFGIKKTTARIRKHFTWPGISSDVKTRCTTCPQCQMAARNDRGKVPLIPLPVITVPYSRLAFDVVGLAENKIRLQIYTQMYVLCLQVP